MSEERQLAVMEHNEVAVIMHRLGVIRELREEVMREGVHFGTSPGTDTPALWQAGADILKITFAFRAIAHVERDPDLIYPHRGYIVTTDIIDRKTDEIVATGYGSCSTMEKKHRWRWASRTCPACKQDTIRKGAAQYGGGWFCRDKTCRAKFKEGDATIEGQEVGSIENADLADLHNTVLKVAKKRSFVDGILDATGAREQFMPPPEDEDEEETQPKEKPKQQKAQPKQQKAEFQFQPDHLYVGTLMEAVAVNGMTPGHIAIETEHGPLVCLFRVTPEAIVNVPQWDALKGKPCSLSFLEKPGASGAIYHMVDNFEILLDDKGAAA